MEIEDKLPAEVVLVERRVRENWHLVSVTVRRCYPQLSDSDREEVESAGYLALTQAAMCYDEKRSASFRTHAIARIRYAAHESVLTCAAGAFAHRRLEKWADLALLPSCVPLEAFLPGRDGAESRQTFADLIPSTGKGIEEAFTEGEAAQDLWRMVEETLPEKHGAVIRSYYIEGKNFQQIAEVHGVSHQRIGQIYRSALNTLRAKMTGSLRH